MRATITSVIPVLIAFAAGALVLTPWWKWAVPIGMLAVVGGWYEILVLRRQIDGLYTSLDQVMREKAKRTR